jgi:hypothetical protein
MLKKILIGLAVLVAVFVAVVVTRPDTYQVERAQTVAAPAGVAYAQVADFRNWKAWSPWEKLDPAMKTSFGGTPGEVGSTYSWSGNSDVGIGKMTVKEAKPGELVRIQLEFIEPYAATSDSVFSFVPQGAGTQVKWVMKGDHNFMSKAMGLFMDMDAMIGKDFEKGLAQLSTHAEAAAKRQAAEAAQ